MSVLTTRKKMIVLQFKEIEKEFANTDELREFMQLQRDSWSWLQEIEYEGQLDQLWRIYNNYLHRINNFLIQYEQHEDNQD